MVTVLVILDGASEAPSRRCPARYGPTSLERARTPTLDRLCAEGLVAKVRTIPDGLPAGSEVGIPTLLGVKLTEAPGRGGVEAAAAGVVVPEGKWAWRVDLPRGAEIDDRARSTARDHRLLRLRGHRFLFVGNDRPSLPEPWRVWPEGGSLPRTLDSSTVVVGAIGAAVGCARLLGARTVVPPGATGGPDTNYSVKARAALAELRGAAVVVVHIGAPDEAAHSLDPNGKVHAIEQADTLVLAPLRDAVDQLGGTLVVCPDHGTDPTTGEHLSDPVPVVVWGPAAAPSGPGRLRERDLVDATVLLPLDLIGAGEAVRA